MYAEAPDGLVESDCELRVGGRWTITFGAPGGEPARETNVFEEVERPRRLVFSSTMKMRDGPEIHTRVTVTFELENGKTRVRIGQRGLSSPERRDTFGGGRGRILDRLNHKAKEIRMAHESDAALGRLEVLIGRWKTEGRTIDASGAPSDQIDAIDTYERLPGGALLHLVDAKVGDQKVEGAELIGHDPDRNIYATQSFGTDGLTAYEASLTEESEGLTWRMKSKTTRFTGRFNEDRNVITGHWELQDDSGDWQPWMEITLTKQAS